MSAPCVVTGCESKAARRIKGACPMHDARMRSTGSYGPPGRLRAAWNQSCSVSGCDRHAKCEGMCEPHRRRERLYGAPEASHRRETRRCSHDGCDEKHWAKSFCRRHYKRWLANGTPDLLSPEDRFWMRVQMAGDDECWEWIGARVRGYGHSHVDREHFYAHRRSYELANGPIPDGLVIRHRCDNPPCVNPRHLEIGTMQDNTNDMIARGRGHWQRRRIRGDVA